MVGYDEYDNQRRLIFLDELLRPLHDWAKD